MTQQNTSKPGLRTMCSTLAPGFFQGPDEIGKKYLWNIGLGFDMIVQKLDEGVHDHFCLDADESALQYIGSDRGVLRGLTESADSYRRRLQRALDDYQHAGNAWAVLSQTLGYLLAFTPAARTVSTYYDEDGAPQHSMWQQYAAGTSLDLPPQYTRSEPADWDWDELSPSTGSWGWWRWYLVLDAVSPQAWTEPAPKLGDFGSTKLGEYTGSIGSTSPTTVGKSIKLIVGQWKSGVAHWIVVSFDDAEFNPGAMVNPDGYYGRWSKLSGRLYVRARSVNGRYFRGQ